MITRCNEPVAGAVERLLRERDEKQYVVARRAGFSPQAFNDMLRGRRLIKPRDVVAIAAALEIPPGELFE